MLSAQGGRTYSMFAGIEQNFLSSSFFLKVGEQLRAPWNQKKTERRKTLSLLITLFYWHSSSNEKKTDSLTGLQRGEQEAQVVRRRGTGAEGVTETRGWGKQSRERTEIESWEAR